MNEMVFTAIENMMVFCAMVVVICGPMLAFLYGAEYICNKMGWAGKITEYLFSDPEEDTKKNC